MTFPFTEHLKHSNPNSYPDEEVQSALLRLLRSQMRRRGLLGLPPAYLGYRQYRSWKDDGAEDELLLDCYLSTFSRNRWPLLRRKIDEFGNVDGIIRRNVAGFLTELQKRHDGIGYAVFKNLEAAVKLGIELGTITATNLRRGKIHNSTVLQFNGTENTVSTEAAQLMQALRVIDVWPQVEQQLARISAETQDLLRQCLERLSQARVSRARFGDLVDVLKSHARSASIKRYGPAESEGGWEGDGEQVEYVRLVDPDLSVDDRDLYTAIIECIADHIAQLTQKRVRDRLGKIFHELIDAVARDDTPPKQAEIVRLLDFPRSTVSDAFTRLEQFTDDCRAKLG